MNELKKLVLTVIAKSTAPIKPGDICAHADLRDEEKQQIYQKLFELNRDEWVVKDETRAYSITAKGRAALEGAPEAEPEKKPRKKSTAAANTNGSVREMADIEKGLIQAEEDAQAALDRYLSQVGNQEIIGPLRRSRDAAREALKNYRARQP